MYYKIALLNSPLLPLTYACEDELKRGNIVVVPLQKKERQGVVVEKVAKPEFACEEVISVKEVFYSELTLGLARFIAEYYVCSKGEALGLFIPQSRYKHSLQRSVHVNFTLSHEQQAAFNFIQKHERSLLFGDTGSGKTEIYIKCIQKYLDEGKTALLLMPEIGLTPQMQNRLKDAFGDLVAIWHSKITKKKKEQVLEDLKEGKVAIIAGTRSALFLPLENLGIIIVDEEHDDSYKSSQRPRYNARDLALLFAKRKEAKILLGSATPSLTSYKNLPRYRLRGTYFSSTKALLFEHAHNELSSVMLAKIAEHLKKKSQIIIFVPTRANFKYVACQACGQRVLCPFCSVGMSLHVDKNALKCHYCNYAQRVPQECPTCKSHDMISKRIGTAEVSTRLKEFFPEHIIEKFDRDEVRSQRKLKATLKAFNEQKIDILVGTQMLAKGHDYHGVNLAVIIGIDTFLNMPDFKAREKAMTLLQQVAGRAGRKGFAEVYVQTQNEALFEEFFHDYEAFIQDEMPYREGMYPPFTKLLKILVSHKNEEKAAKIMEEVEKIARGFSGLEVVGHGKSNIEKIAGKYRYNMLVRSNDAKALLQLGHTCKPMQVEIDMDPLSFS